MISGSGDWTVIFSKNWNTWGTNYAEKDDALRVPAKVTTASSSTDKLNYTIDKSGKVQLHWGNKLVEFNVAG